MDRFYHKIAPRFLQQWDQKLLIHYPWIWATRIHHVVFWFMASLCLISLLAWGQMQTFSLCLEEDFVAIENTMQLISYGKVIGLGLWVWALCRNHWLNTKFLLSSSQGFIRMMSFFFGLFLLGGLPIFYAVFLHLFGLPLDILIGNDTWQMTWMSGLVLTPFLALLFEIGSYIKKFEFLALLFGRISLMAASMLIYSISEWIGLDSIVSLEWGFFIYVVLEVILLLRLGYRAGTPKYKIDFRIIALGIVPIVLSFIQFFWILNSVYVMFFEENIDLHENFYLIYFSCIGLAALTWHFFLRRRVMYLQAQAWR